MNAVILWLAQGFGIGRIPVAPGTFGSILGFLWFAVLLLTGNLWLLVAGTILGIVISVWVCGRAEKILGKKDPGSVVLDEVAAIPVCFAGWLGFILWKTGTMPPVDYFFSSAKWLPMAGIFAAFRLFDVWKPWPVRQSQSLPGGWGVTIDDVLAGIYVAVLSVMVLIIWR